MADQMKWLFCQPTPLKMRRILNSLSRHLEASPMRARLRDVSKIPFEHAQNPFSPASMKRVWDRICILNAIPITGSKTAGLAHFGRFKAAAHACAASSDSLPCGESGKIEMLQFYIVGGRAVRTSSLNIGAEF
jgi:hypothetical protein